MSPKNKENSQSPAKKVMLKKRKLFKNKKATPVVLPKAEEPKAEEPKAEEPKAEEPKEEKSDEKSEEPKAEELKSEEKSGELKSEEPKAEDSKPKQPVKPNTPMTKKNKKASKVVRYFKLYCEKGEFFNVFSKKKEKKEELVEEKKLDEQSNSQELAAPAKPFTQEKKKKKKTVQTSRGRCKGATLGEGAYHVYSSLVRAFNKAGKKIPKKLKYGIIECTKNLPENKNKLYKYEGTRRKLDEIKVVPIVPKDTYNKKTKKIKKAVNFSATFRDLEGAKKYLVEVKYDEEKKDDEKKDNHDIVYVKYEKRKKEPKTDDKTKKKVSHPRVVEYTKYYKIVGEDSLEEDRVKNLIVYLYEHEVKRVKGIDIIDPVKEKKKKDKKKKERKLINDKNKKKKKKFVPVPAPVSLAPALVEQK